MGAAGDNFCLRWNDFETNISNSFRELRKDNEFFDVTLCCDNGTDRLQAHKVILAACSPLFRRILGGYSYTNSRGVQVRHGGGLMGGTPVNSQPLLYLKGIHQRELEAVLNFMYHGEVNVAQDELNTFLAVAEELAVKGLTTESKNGSRSLGAGGIGMPELGGEDFGETDSDFTPVKKGQSLKRISFGGGKSSFKKSTSLGQTDRERNIASIPSQPRTGVNKRSSEIALHEPDVESKRVKSDPDSIQIGDATSLAVTEHAGTSEPVQVDTGDFGDDGGGDPDFDDSYGYTEGDLDETAGAASGSDAAKVETGAEVIAAESAVEVEEANFVRGKRGTLLVDGAAFNYAVNRKSETKLYWKCVECKSRGCRGRAVTQGFYIIYKSGQHNHSPHSPRTRKPYTRKQPLR